MGQLVTDAAAETAVTDETALTDETEVTYETAVTSEMAVTEVTYKMAVTDETLYICEGLEEKKKESRRWEGESFKREIAYNCEKKGVWDQKWMPYSQPP